MAFPDFLQSIIEETIKPGVQRLMEGRYFSELREGKLSIRRLQGWALQHYLHNVALCKGFALCLVKNAHDPALYDYFLHQLNEERDHPDLAKRFGLALNLREDDFRRASPVFECRAHTSAVIAAMFLASPAENRASALVNESMVQRYSEEFHACLQRHYGLRERELEFFSVHAVADRDHVARAAAIIARHAETAEARQRVREVASHMVRFKLAKFEGIYHSYA